MQPVLLFPFFMAYINGPLKFFITQQGCYIVMAIIFVIFINMGLNQGFSFFYRFAHISPLTAVGFFEVSQ